MTYYVRVELRGADPKDYEDLHDFMKTEGFSRTVISGDDVKYWLPSATYRAGSWATSAAHAREDAAKAARLTGKAFSVFATSGPASWEGLRRVS